MVEIRSAADAQALGMWIEAERCWAIMSAPLAQERPSLAWDALPLGLGVAETLELIETLPQTPTDKTYPERLALLDERRTAALTVWRARQCCEVLPLN